MVSAVEITGASCSKFLAYDQEAPALSTASVSAYLEEEKNGIFIYGSSGYYKTLIPHQAYDRGFEEGCKNAVYATTNKNMALAFALGAIPDANGELERVMLPEYGDKMIFMKGTQLVCFEEVEPVDIQEINVDDYLYLCQVKEDGIPQS